MSIWKRLWLLATVAWVLYVIAVVIFPEIAIFHGKCIRALAPLFSAVQLVLLFALAKQEDGKSLWTAVVSALFALAFTGLAILDLSLSKPPFEAIAGISGMSSLLFLLLGWGWAIWLSTKFADRAKFPKYGAQDAAKTSERAMALTARNSRTADEVTLHLHPGSPFRTNFKTEVSVEVALKSKPPLPSSRCAPLFDCWIYWPPDKRWPGPRDSKFVTEPAPTSCSPPVFAHPVLIAEHPGLPRGVTWDYQHDPYLPSPDKDPNCTRFWADTQLCADTDFAARHLCIRFDSFAVLVALALEKDYWPFVRQGLSLGFRIYAGAPGDPAVIVHIEYPSSFAFRLRRDTAFASSSPTSLDENHDRRTMFFKTNQVYLRYAFGVNDRRAFVSFLAPWVRLAWVSLALAASLLMYDRVTKPPDSSDAHLAPLIVPFLAVALVAWFLETFDRPRLPSIRASRDEQAFVWALLLQLYVTGVTVSVILFNWPEGAALPAGIAIGVIGMCCAVGVGVRTLMLFGMQARVGYMCDACEEWLGIRVPVWAQLGRKLRLPRDWAKGVKYSSSGHCVCDSCIDAVADTCKNPSSDKLSELVDELVDFPKQLKLRNDSAEPVDDGGPSAGLHGEGGVRRAIVRVLRSWWARDWSSSCKRFSLETRAGRRGTDGDVTQASRPVQAGRPQLGEGRRTGGATRSDA